MLPAFPPPSLRARAWTRSGGQATVELVALLPSLVALAALLWQLALAGHALWSASAAARAAARAHAVGADAASAARARLPAGLAERARVDAASDGSVAVAVPIPRLLPPLDLGRATGRAYFSPQR